MFDITKRSSFAHLQSWLEEVRKQGSEGISVLVVGNKADLAADREVSREEAEAFARANSLKYIETSAKTAENVDTAFLSSAQEIYDKIKRGELYLESEEEKKSNSASAATVAPGRTTSGRPEEKKSSCCNVD